MAAVAQDAADVPPAMDKPCPTPAKTYQQAGIGDVLEKEYGVVKGGPSRNRRAGAPSAEALMMRCSDVQMMTVSQMPVMP